MSVGTGAWVATTRRQSAEAARWYAEADIHGVRVRHLVRPCDNFTSTRDIRMRDVGTVAFDIDSSRWFAWVAADCNAVDLSTLLAFACKCVSHFEDGPWRELGSKFWVMQQAGAFSPGTSFAASVAYQLSAADLHEPAVESVSVPDSLASMTVEGAEWPT